MFSALRISIDISFLSLNFRSKILESIFNDFFPIGPSIFTKEPLIAIFTFSGIDIFIFPIFDIKIPYKLFLHLFFVFLHQHLS